MTADLTPEEMDYIRQWLAERGPTPVPVEVTNHQKIEFPAFPAFPQLPDYSDELTAMTKAIAGVAPKAIDFAPLVKVLASVSGVEKAVRGLSDDMQALLKAVEKLTDTVGTISPPDMGQLEKAMKASAAATEKLASAFTKPKRFVFSRDGNPIGFEIDETDDEDD